MQNLPTNPKLYEINTRVWLRRFDTAAQRAILDHVPVKIWDDLADKGINIVWLMGVWKTNPTVVEKYALTAELVQGYRRALADWRREDVIGSPYAVDSYVINPDIGSKESLQGLRAALHQRGMLLMLDFVPNHFSADSQLIQTHPEYFLPGNEALLRSDPNTFYRPGPQKTAPIFAHGRDPYFPAWSDSVQVNYYNPAARHFMTETLLQLAQICDGVRCDMAMLVLNDVFSNTWREVVSEMNYEIPREEFWPQAIGQVKARFPQFIFMAEAYWDKEWALQQQGFDYTYDKKLLDRLCAGPVDAIRGHLRADRDYQARSVRFLENHDEDRAVTALGKEKSLAAAVVISTIPGLRFYHDGQLEGKRLQLPIQLGREPLDPLQQDIQDFYQQLLTMTKSEVFVNGDWQLLSATAAWEGNVSYQNILAWLWRYKQERRLVAVNYSEQVSQCHLQCDINGRGEPLEFTDLLSGRIYRVSHQEFQEVGLSIELQPYQSHVFLY
jgi:hypothetical protein